MLALADVIDAAMLQGVFTQLGQLIPIVIPVIVGFIGLRKGLSFVMGSIRRA